MKELMGRSKPRKDSLLLIATTIQTKREMFFFSQQKQEESESTSPAPMLSSFMIQIGTLKMMFKQQLEPIESDKRLKLRCID